MTRYCKLALLFCLVYTTVHAQQIVPLYTDGHIPMAKPGGETPTLTIYRTKGNKPAAAVIVCPGGGYGARMDSYEGAEPCAKLNAAGITALLLDYRLPNDKYMYTKWLVPLTDAQRAIQYVREHAAELNIDPQQVGIMGFSAGGHLAASAGTLFNATQLTNPNNISLRPDFVILAYPVVSMQSGITHAGSRDNLLGTAPDSSLVQKFSIEEQVNAYTAPMFITHGLDDGLVPVNNSLLLYAALQNNGVPTQLLLYKHGQHGYGIFNKQAKAQWFDACINWIKTQKWKL